MYENELLKSAEIAVDICLNVKEDDRFLVITDPILYEIGKYLFDVGLKKSKNTILTVINPTGAHGAPLSEYIAQIMKEATVIAAPTFYSISHTDARRNACKNGARCATLPGITKEIMARSLQADYNSIAELSNKLADILTNANEAIVISDKNELRLTLNSRKGFADTGLVHSPGDFSNLPAGESYIAPMEEISEGKLMINGSIFDSGKLAENDYIYVTIAKGYITKIDGNKSAKHLDDIFSNRDKSARSVAELGIGTNPKAIITGNILEDEKALNTIHIAFGDNASMGGKNDKAGIHLDAIIISPTLYLDNELIIKDGVIKVK